MQFTSVVGTVVWVLAGIAQGADSHVGWWAEAHWVLSTTFLLLDAMNELSVIDGRNTRTLATAAVPVLVLITVLARMWKRVWHDLAAMFERVFPNGEGCGYIVAVSVVTGLSDYGNISTDYAAFLIVMFLQGMVLGLYVGYLLRERLREYEWKLHDIKRRFLRWVRRDDAWYTGDTVDTVVEFRFTWVRPESDDESE